MTRNPLYLGSCCFALSISVFFKSILLVLLTLTALMIYIRWIIPKEEEALEHIFGDNFLNYKAVTPLIIPDFSLYHSKQTIEVNLAPLSTEVRNLFGTAMMPFLIFILMQLRETSWWLHWFTLP